MSTALLLGKDEVIQQIIPHFKINALVRAAPATFIIYADWVETKNANNPHGEGRIDPANFVPFPKNPLIAKFFIQFSRVEELGFGILTTTRLKKEYAGKRKAVFIEGETFKTIIPMPDGKAVAVNDTVKYTLNNTVNDTINDTATFLQV